MKKSRITLLIIISLSFSAIPLGLFVFVSTQSTNSLNESSLPSYEPFDIGTSLRNLNNTPELKVPTTISSPNLQTSSTLGDFKYWLWYDDTDGLYITEYQLRAIGSTCEVWVMTDLNFPIGDPRNPVIVTDEQLQYLAYTFDNSIYNPITDYFGAEEKLYGIDATLDDILFDLGLIPEPDPNYYSSPEGKNVILVSNIGDESYYDYTYPSYIAGFYWGSVYEPYFDRNIINIDSYDWEYRLGTPEDPWFGDDPTKWRPNLYESTIAHEYQHLVHDDWLPGDQDYMNEACSLFAEPLCGFELDASQIEWFLATPDNSLTEWGDQGGYNILADYGASFLWALYLTDWYGADFLQRYVQGEPGLKQASIPRISALLPEGIDFYDVYHNWRIANLLDSKGLGEGLYDYLSIELNTLDPLQIYEFDKESFRWTKGISFGDSYTHPTTYYPEGINLHIKKLGPFGSDYIEFTGLQGLNNIYFDGDDYADYKYKWHYDADCEKSPTGHTWYSGKGDLINILLKGSVFVPNTENLTLELTTYWDIEDDFEGSGEYLGWDYGFVQISLDGGETWQSLSNEYTWELPIDNCYSKIVDNLPGLTGCTKYYTKQPYITMTFNLPEESCGKEVLIGFCYMTDWGTTYKGWYIYDAQVCGNSFFGALANEPKEADFDITIIEFTENGYNIKEAENYIDLYETATFYDISVGSILIVSPVTEYGWFDYRFKN